ncbi:MAG: hypothetical protein WC236_00040 [Gallionellaceae bacterium]
MAQTFPEIEELIDSGMALPAINEFIQFAITLSIGIRTGQMEELPGTQATIIAAVALQKLMDTTDGRKTLGIKASNKVYNEKEFGLESPQLEIARRMGCGEITRKQALSELTDHYYKTDQYPSRQTITRILNSLEEEANSFRGKLEVMLRAAGWDGGEGNLESNLSEILEKLRPKKQPK